MSPALCLLCGGVTGEVLSGVRDTRFGVPKAYAIVRCGACGFEQTDPLPSPAELGSLYEAHYNSGGGKGTAYSRAREAFLFSAAYRAWLAVDGDVSFHGLRGKGRLLDVGCNEGRSLTLYRRNGYEAEGLELNPPAREEARRRGFLVHAEALERFRPERPYDVVVLSNVLEHSLSPKDMLGHVHRVLKDGGEAWISCPHRRSWMRDLFGRAWINWHVPFHISHFSAGDLDRLLAAAGFHVVSRRQATPALWAAQSLAALLFARPGRPTRALRNPLLMAAGVSLWRGLLFPVLALGDLLGRGDCLVVRARKEAPCAS